MKAPIKYLLWLSLAAALITCKPEKVEPDPLTDGKPRILSIAFPGIPKKDVSIDQKNLIITIKVPPVLLSSSVEPVLQLTENAFMFDSWQRVLRGDCEGCENILIGLKGSREYDATVYKVKLVPSGPLEVGVMSGPVKYILYKELGFFIPMINLYANLAPESIFLTNRTTREKILIDNSRSTRGVEQEVNHFFIYMFNVKNQLPGTYDIDLKMADGKTLRIPQPLILAKGLALLSSYENVIFYGQDVRVSSTFFMEGYNLFEGDITLELTDRNGVKTPLTNLIFEPYGLSLGIPLPKTVGPGQYVMRLSQFGKDVGRCFRLNVRNGETPEARIGTIGGDAMPCSLQEPLRIERGKAVPITYGLPQSLPNNPRIKLTPANDASRTFYGSVAPILLQPNALGPGRLTIAGEVPAGLYSATLQYLNSDGQVEFETEPYGQLLEVY